LVKKILGSCVACAACEGGVQSAFDSDTSVAAGAGIFLFDYPAGIVSLFLSSTLIREQ